MSTAIHPTLRGRLDPWVGPLKLLAAAVFVWLLRVPLLWLGAKLALIAGNLLHDIVGMPFLTSLGSSGVRLGPFRYMNEDWDQIAGYFSVHVQIVVEVVAISLAIALPIGIVLHRFRWLYLPVFTGLDAIYTIPSLALFAVLIPTTGITNTTVVIPLVAYAQFILVRNVVVGLDGVPPEVKEAASGMGMNRLQVLLKVELPLALPVIVTGLRIATVVTIGSAAVAALIAIQDLGRLFIDATTNGGVNAYSQIEAGAIAVTALALGADMLLRIVERFIPANRVARAGGETQAARWLRSFGFIGPWWPSGSESGPVTE